MTTPIRIQLPHVGEMHVVVDPVQPRILDTPGVLNQRLRSLVQEERSNEEFNKRFVEELERQRWLDEIRSRLFGTVLSGAEPRERQNLQEDDLERALRRSLEELRRRETELFERFDQLKHTQIRAGELVRLPELPRLPPIEPPELRLPRLIETPEQPLPPWERRWAVPPRLPPLSVRQGHREAVPA
jgi:hypothetical protein